MFRYKLYWEDGSDAGETDYSIALKPGDTIRLSNGQAVRVIDLVQVAEDSHYNGLLMVEAA